MRARDVDRLGTGRARAVGADDRYAGPAERLREGRAGHVAGVTVAHRVPTDDEPHVFPRDPSVGQGLIGRFYAVFDEVSPPLAPRMHTAAEDRDRLHHRPLLTPAPRGRFPFPDEILR